MFNKGDLVIYGYSGVCKVADIGLPASIMPEQDKMYYKLTPVFGSETIYAPVDTPIFMRCAMQRSEADVLIDKIPDIEEHVCTDRNIGVLREFYEALLRTHKTEDLLQLIKSIYTKNTSLLPGKKPGNVETQYMKRAEELLYGELSVALGIQKENVVDYIKSRIECNYITN